MEQMDVQVPGRTGWASSVVQNLVHHAGSAHVEALQLRILPHTQRASLILLLIHSLHKPLLVLASLGKRGGRALACALGRVRSGPEGLVGEFSARPFTAAKNEPLSQQQRCKTSSRA